MKTTKYISIFTTIYLVFQILESTIELMILKLEQRGRIFLSLKIQVAQCDCDFLHSNPMNSV